MLRGEEPLQHVAYVYDGTLEGLLSAVFLAYERHEEPEDIVPLEMYEPRLGQSSIPVETDFARADRVRRGIERAAGRAAFTAVMRASTCDNYETGAVVLAFVRYVMARPVTLKGEPVLDELANPFVVDLKRLEKRCVNECEKMRQFVRFSHLRNGVWFAKVAPNASVVPLVMGYFADRLNDQPFIIYDEAHRIAGVYDGRSWQLVRGDVADVPAATEHDALMQEAWRRFYDALAIGDRYNPELRRHFMPVRLWSNLPEMALAPVLGDEGNDGRRCGAISRGEGETAFGNLTVSPVHSWSRRQESNPQPPDYKSDALPLSHAGKP